MELVQSWAVAVMGELDLELQFILLHRQLAHGAESADAWTAPGAIRPPGWEFSIADCCSGLLAKDCFVRHLRLRTPGPQRDLGARRARSEEHTSELQSRQYLV